MNNHSLEDYISLLDDLDPHVRVGLIFLQRDDHVHHLDENCTNDVIDNLAVISASEHARLHALERHNNLRFVAVADRVSSIEPVGIREVFDLKMEAPFNNYVANSFVTHNSGKTTLTLHAIAEAQKRGGLCAFIDAEHALDPQYAAALGVDMNELVISQPDTGEQALEIAETLTASGAFDIIVIDSVAALVPKAEIDGDMGDKHVGLQARLMSQACRKLSGVVNRTRTIFIFINQIRMKIGVKFGSPETTSGGRALKYYSSVRLDIRRIASIKKEGEDSTGNRSRVKVVKNKVAAPFKVCEFDIVFGKGVNTAGEILDAAVDLGLVEKSGSWYSMSGEDGQRLGQGRDNSCQFLRDTPELMESLHKQVRKELRLDKEPVDAKAA